MENQRIKEAAISTSTRKSCSKKSKKSLTLGCIMIHEFEGEHAEGKNNNSNMSFKLNRGRQLKCTVQGKKKTKNTKSWISKS